VISLVRHSAVAGVSSVPLASKTAGVKGLMQVAASGGPLRIGDVVDREGRPQRALQTNEGERAATHTQQRDAFGLDALVVAAAVVVDAQPYRFAVEIAAAVEDDVAAGVSNRKRVGAELDQRPAARRVDVRQVDAAELAAVGNVLDARIAGGAAALVLAVAAAVVARVALVGQHQVGVAVVLVGGDRVGLVQAEHRDAAQAQLAVLVIGIDLVAGQREVLQAEVDDPVEAALAQVEQRQAIGLLKRHVGVVAALVDGDVLRLRAVGAVGGRLRRQAAGGGEPPQRVVARDRSIDRQRRDTARGDVDDADAAHRIDGALADRRGTLVGRGFVGHQHLATTRRERQHVG
jgi:hypothetical protein